MTIQFKSKAQHQAMYELLREQLFDIEGETTGNVSYEQAIYATTKIVEIARTVDSTWYRALIGVCLDNELPVMNELGRRIYSLRDIP